MATSTQKKNGVPRGTANPIEYLIQRGWSEPGLAVEWGLKTETSVKRLRAFNHVPKYTTAQRMAQTFGWSSAGEVMDFYAARASRKVA